MKFLLHRGKYKDRIKRFLAIDGGDQGGITRGGVGSKRYRVTYKGPGGHSYGAFGLVNPAYAMAAAIARFSDLQVPSSPKTTFNVGVVTGGTSVNSIPSEVSMDVDMRSESCAELKKVDDAFLAIVKGSVADENRARSTREGGIQADPKVIGERPCGETSDGCTDPQDHRRGRAGVRTEADLQRQQHRQQHSDEHGHPGADHRPRRPWRPQSFTGRVDGRRSRRAWRNPWKSILAIILAVAGAPLT